MFWNLKLPQQPISNKRKALQRPQQPPAVNQAQALLIPDP